MTCRQRRRPFRYRSKSIGYSEARCGACHRSTTLSARTLHVRSSPTKATLKTARESGLGPRQYGSAKEPQGIADGFKQRAAVGYAIPVVTLAVKANYSDASSHAREISKAADGLCREILAHSPSIIALCTTSALASCAGLADVEKLQSRYVREEKTICL